MTGHGGCQSNCPSKVLLTLADTHPLLSSSRPVESYPSSRRDPRTKSCGVHSLFLVFVTLIQGLLLSALRASYRHANIKNQTK